MTSQFGNKLAVSRAEKSTPLEKTFAVLEFVAERGGATAKELSDALGYPMPSVYRLAKALVQTGYLVHLKDQSRYELGYKPHQLAVSLHQQIGIPVQVKSVISGVHQQLSMASYFAVYRGADVVVAYVVDSPAHPRLTPLNFGFHEASHATAFGKIMLAGMDDAQRDQYLAVHEPIAMQKNTITDLARLSEHLQGVMLEGIAWENEEFVQGKTCAAVGVHNAAGRVVGAVAVSADTATITGQERQVENTLRNAANNVSKYFRMGLAH